MLFEIGGAILSALVRVRAGLVIAAAAFLELAVFSAKSSIGLSQPLEWLFTIVSFCFGSGSVLTMVMFLVEQFFKLRE
jgi:hypothetical protein